MTTTTIKLFLAINEAGDFMTSTDGHHDAIELLQTEYTCEAVRTIVLTISVDLPAPEAIPVSVMVPAEVKTPAEVTVS